MFWPRNALTKECFDQGVVWHRKVLTKECFDQGLVWQLMKVLTKVIKTEKITYYYHCTNHQKNKFRMSVNVSIKVEKNYPPTPVAYIVMVSRSWNKHEIWTSENTLIKCSRQMYFATKTWPSNRIEFTGWSIACLLIMGEWKIVHASKRTMTSFFLISR